MAFTPLETKVDVQEYVPGLFDILDLKNSKVPLTKVLSTFCYLQIESINLKNEIEQKYFDPLIFFGESGSLYQDEQTDEEFAGTMELEMSRCLPGFNEFRATLRKLIMLTKNICLQMDGLFNAKFALFTDALKKTNYMEIFDNLGSMLTSLYTVDLVIQENTAFQDYWEQYTKMLAKVSSNLDHYNMTKKMLKKLEKKVKQIYSWLMQGRLF